MGSKIQTPEEFLSVPGEPTVSWERWLLTVEDFFFLIDRTATVNQKLDDKAKNLYLCQFLGAEGRRIASACNFYTNRGTMTHKQFTKALAELFFTKVNEARAAFDLRTRFQRNGESVTLYITELRSLITRCNYGNANIENRLLAEQLVIGCSSRISQEKLLSQPIDLNSYLNIMLADEAAQKDVTVLQDKFNNLHVSKVVQCHGSNTPKIKSKTKCYGCGSTEHVIRSEVCPANGKVCSICGKKDHFAKVCHSGKSFKSKRFSNKSNWKKLRINNVVIKNKNRPQIDLKVQTEKGTILVCTTSIDTGSDISTITHNKFRSIEKEINLEPIEQVIRNFDGTKIKKIIGKFTAKIIFKERSAFGVIYVTENDLTPTLGLDLIQALNINIRGADLFVSAIDTISEYLEDFPNLTAETLGTFGLFKHHIQLKPDAIPKQAKLRPIPYARRDLAIAECQKMVEQGIWIPVERTSWTHALVVVPKSDGNMRLTTDLTSLNKFVVPERHPIPNVADIFVQLRGAKFFTKLDLRKGYFHIELDEDSYALTTTITPAGLFAYKRLPMGLTDSASVFQRAVQRTLSNCHNVQAYIDDIVVFGKTKVEHDKAVRNVLQQLNDNDFRLNIQKCEFCKSSINYLGHLISFNSIKPDPKNVDPILKAPEPTSLKQVQSFLGAVNYYASFITGVAEVVEPLRALTRKGSSLYWTSREAQAFEATKEAITNAVSLAIFDLNAPTFVTTDASNVGLGAVLTQIQDNKEVPIAYASHTLSSTERNYSVGEREALACLWACEHWETFLLGRKFTLRTDHAALTTLLFKHSSTRKSAKFLRWLDRLSVFDYEIKYKRGKENVVADFLSRSPNENFDSNAAIVDTNPHVNSMTTENISIETFNRHQRSNTVCQQLREYIVKGWPSKEKIPGRLAGFLRFQNELSIEQDLIVREDRILVPESMQKMILDCVHEGHPGIVRMKRQLRRIYWWPGQDKDVEQYVKYCIPCQHSVKSHKRPVIEPNAIPLPTRPWSKLAIDVLGPFDIAPSNQRYVVCLIDYHSKYPEVLLTYSITSGIIIQWLRKIFAHHGNPDIIVSDNGTNFTSSEFTSFLHSRDILHWRTPNYEPQRNGLVEVFNRTLVHGIQTFKAAKKSFSEGINDILFAYRSTPSTSGDSPAKLLFGRNMRANYEPRRALEAERPKDATELKKSTSKLKPGQWIRVRRPRVPKGLSPYSEPIQIEETLGEHTVRTSDGKVWGSRNFVVVRSPAIDDDILSEGGNDVSALSDDKNERSSVG